MTIQNGVMMQHFHWYTPADGSFWRDVEAQAGALAQAGFTALWLPPAYKGICSPACLASTTNTLTTLNGLNGSGDSLIIWSFSPLLASRSWFAGPCVWWRRQLRSRS